MKTMGLLWKGMCCLCGISVTFLPMAPLISYAADPMCVFVSQKGTAWVVRKDLSVKVSLKVGDFLYPGDQVIVMHGNTVHLAFDKDLQNIIQIEGESLLQLISSMPLNIELYKGKVFAVINKKTPSSQFRITTPAAIASVRGTQYQVTHNDEEGSKILTYEGSVEVAGRVDGKETKEVVIVKAGQKTSVKAPGEKPGPVQPMTAEEKGRVKAMMTNMNSAKVNYTHVAPGKLDELPAPAATPAPEKIQKTSKTPAQTKSKAASTTSNQNAGNRVIV